MPVPTANGNTDGSPAHGDFLTGCMPHFGHIERTLAVTSGCIGERRAGAPRELRSGRRAEGGAASGPAARPSCSAVRPSSCSSSSCPRSRTRGTARQPSSAKREERKTPGNGRDRNHSSRAFIGPPHGGGRTTRPAAWARAGTSWCETEARAETVRNRSLAGDMESTPSAQRTRRKSLEPGPRRTGHSSAQEGGIRYARCRGGAAGRSPADLVPLPRRRDVREPRSCPARRHWEASPGVGPGPQYRAPGRACPTRGLAGGHRAIRRRRSDSDRRVAHQIERVVRTPGPAPRLRPREYGGRRGRAPLPRVLPQGPAESRRRPFPCPRSTRVPARRNRSSTPAPRRRRTRRAGR